MSVWSWLLSVFRDAGDKAIDDLKSKAVDIIRPDPGEGPGHWPGFEGPLEHIPVGMTAVYKTYGDPCFTHGDGGSVRVAPQWERASMAKLTNLPGYSGKLYVHRLVAPYLREALRRAAIACPGYKIRTLGCFAPRHMRHDKSRPYSYHSWGIAIDINASTNKANYKDEPGDMPEAFVEAFESVGCEWGGRWKGYRDDMHFQLVKTR